MGAKLLAPVEGWWPSATKWVPIGYPQNFVKIQLNLAEILRTSNLGRYAPKFLAPVEGWWPSATDWQGLNFFLRWR